MLQQQRWFASSSGDSDKQTEEVNKFIKSIINERETQEAGATKKTSEPTAREDAETQNEKKGEQEEHEEALRIFFQKASQTFQTFHATCRLVLKRFACMQQDKARTLRGQQLKTDKSLSICPKDANGEICSFTPKDINVFGV